VRYVENEAWPICNNACENSIRPFVLGRNNAQPQIMRSLSLPKSAVPVAELIHKNSRFGELRIITATPGTAECGPAVDIDGSLPVVVECCSVLAPSLSDQLLYSRALSTGFRVPAIKR
jgi:transposase